MALLSAAGAQLVLIDFQGRLMPAIHDGESILANAGRLLKSARLLEVPVTVTEQNPRALGATVSALAEGRELDVTVKMTFDACRAPGFAKRLLIDRDIVVAGCEAHVCVLQTVLGLIDVGRRVFVVRDAIGSRRPESKEAAIRRMERHGAEIVTTEMVLFEWLGSADHPRFREVIALIK